MSDFIVSLFGHREIKNFDNLENGLLPIIKDLIRLKGYVTFLIGRNGEFDEYAASLIKRAQKELGKINNEMNLVIPYVLADINYYENYYDNIIIPESLHGVYPKSAITLKNRWMIDMSDLVIVCVEREKGGAYAAMKYAERQKKKVINIYGL